MRSLQFCLLVSSMLFAIGFSAVLTRRNAILVLIGVELMLNAANLNFIAFWRLGHSHDHAGILFVLFSIGIAAAEAAVGLALILSIYRQFRTVNVDEISRAQPPSGPSELTHEEPMPLRASP